MKKTVLAVCGLLMLGACASETQNPWFNYSNGNLQCSGGGSSFKPDSEAIEATKDILDTLPPSFFQSAGITEEFIELLGMASITIDGDFKEAATACRDFLKETGSL